MILPQILLFGISGGEILVLLLIVLLLFGPRKIPEIARMVGKGMNEVRKVQREINSEISRYSDDIDSEVRKMDPESAKKAAVAKGKSQTDTTVKPENTPGDAEKRVGPYGKPIYEKEVEKTPDPGENEVNDPDKENNVTEEDEGGGIKGPVNDDLPYPYGKGKNDPD